jgi:hypothetical protein
VRRELPTGWHEVPGAPGDAFDDRLNALLDEPGLDRAVKPIFDSERAESGGFAR